MTSSEEAVNWFGKQRCRVMWLTVFKIYRTGKNGAHSQIRNC